MHIYLHFVTSNEILLDALFKKNYSRKNHAILTHKFCLKFLIIQVLFYVFIEKKKTNNLSRLLYLATSVSKYLRKGVYTHECAHFLRHSEKVSKETPVLFARDHEKKERGICEQINHEFMPLFVFSFCTPPLLSPPLPAWRRVSTTCHY